MGGHVDFLHFFIWSSDAILRWIRQRVCIKCCANLRKMWLRPWQWLDRRFEQKAWTLHGCLNGMLDSGLVGHPLRTGRPISYTMPETVNKLQQLIHEDRSQTIQDLPDEIGIGYRTCQRSLTAERGMHCHCHICVQDSRQCDCHTSPTLLFSVSLIEDKTERPPFWQLRCSRQNCRWC
jgi:hypothetical protein